MSEVFVSLLDTRNERKRMTSGASVPYINNVDQPCHFVLVWDVIASEMFIIYSSVLVDDDDQGHYIGKEDRTQGVPLWSISPVGTPNGHW